MSDEVEVGKKERGKRSPAFPLNEALGFLQAVSQNLGDGPFSRDAIAKALGHTGITGAVSSKIGSLTHFAVLDREGNVYQVSPLGKRLLYPQSESERQEAVAQAARSPSLYGEILKAFSGKSVPGMFGNILIQTFGVGADNAADIAKIFKQTMEFCGLLRHGVLYAALAETGNGETRSDIESATKPEETRPKADAGTGQTSTGIAPVGSHQDYAIPLTKKRSAVLRLPLPLDESDVTRIKGWLDLMKDVLITEQEPDEDTSSS